MTLPAWEDTEVNELASIAVALVLPTVLACVKEPLSESETQSIQDCLSTTLHWAVHIGQSAHQLLAYEQSSNIDRNSHEWDDIVTCLYQRPLIMHGNDENGLLGILSILRAQVWGTKASIFDKRLPSGSLAATLSRLEVDIQQECIGPRYASNKHIGNVLEDHLYKLARLYLNHLEQLLCSTGQSSIATVDCFVSMCAIALSISGDALRILWPV